MRMIANNVTTKNSSFLILSTCSTSFIAPLNGFRCLESTWGPLKSLLFNPCKHVESIACNFRTTQLNSLLLILCHYVLLNSSLFARCPCTQKAWKDWKCIYLSLNRPCSLATILLGAAHLAFMKMKPQQGFCRNRVHG